MDATTQTIPVKIEKYDIDIETFDKYFKYDINTIDADGYDTTTKIYKLFKNIKNISTKSKKATLLQYYDVELTKYRYNNLDLLQTYIMKNITRDILNFEFISKMISCGHQINNYQNCEYLNFCNFHKIDIIIFENLYILFTKFNLFKVPMFEHVIYVVLSNRKERYIKDINNFKYLKLLIDNKYIDNILYSNNYISTFVNSLCVFKNLYRNKKFINFVEFLFDNFDFDDIYILYERYHLKIDDADKQNSEYIHEIKKIDKTKYNIKKFYYEYLKKKENIEIPELI